MTDPEFPSQGGYMMFPYMVSAQFMLYLSGRKGLYMGVHDESRAPKGLDFKCSDEGTDFRVRMFMGGKFGGDVKTPDVVWKGSERASERSRSPKLTFPTGTETICRSS